MSSFYTSEELKGLGLKKLGKNVLISKKSSFYEAGSIIVGDNVRIDDFCILSGNITLGNNIHISAFCALYGKAGIHIGNFSGLSPRCTIFSQVDDFSGDYMVNPTIPDKFRNVKSGFVKISDYVQIGANCILLPGVIAGEGSAVGAFSFVTKNLDPWKIYIGIPAKPIKDRSKELLIKAKGLQGNLFS